MEYKRQIRTELDVQYGKAHKLNDDLAKRGLQNTACTNLVMKIEKLDRKLDTLQTLDFSRRDAISIKVAILAASINICNEKYIDK